MEIDNKYSTLIIAACERVKRNLGINVSFSSIEFYGVHRFSQENVYKVNLMVNNEPLAIYAEEEAFKHGTDVPGSGLSTFKPADFDDWSDYKQLMLAWCGAIYKYCKNLSHYQNAAPPPIEE